ncbi:MAG: ribonuclease P protein component [Candidatus Margulisiibacteriota bacterium]
MLPKNQRLSNSQDIKKVLDKNDLRFNTPLLTFVAKENFLDKQRATVVCSKKVGNAVKRNRIRRKIVMAYQNIHNNIAKKVDIVIIARHNEAEVKDYEDQIQKGADKIGLCNE